MQSVTSPQRCFVNGRQHVDTKWPQSAPKVLFAVTECCTVHCTDRLNCLHGSDRTSLSLLYPGCVGLLSMGLRAHLQGQHSQHFGPWGQAWCCLCNVLYDRLDVGSSGQCRYTGVYSKEFGAGAKIRWPQQAGIGSLTDGTAVRAGSPLHVSTMAACGSHRSLP